MFGSCNIDKTDRINRSIFGIVLFLAAYFGASKHFYMIIGIILLLEGIIGWCSIPVILKKLRITKNRPH